jgi:hypothetical protein
MARRWCAQERECRREERHAAALDWSLISLPAVSSQVLMGSRVAHCKEDEKNRRSLMGTRQQKDVPERCL